MRFVDTSVLLYAACQAPQESAKRRRALEVLDEADMALSVHVLQEFYYQATRRGRQGRLTQGQAQRFPLPLRLYPVQSMTPAIFDHAAAISRRFQISYWDSAIIAAAHSLGCEVVYSEDLNAGQGYDGLRVVNPFREEVDLNRISAGQE